MFPNRVDDLIETMVVYKLSELSREEIQKMLHLPTTDVTKGRKERGKISRKAKVAAGFVCTGE